MTRETLLQVANEYEEIEARNDFLCDELLRVKARVQLLTKALYQARAELAREGCEKEVAAIDAALAEAGIEKVKVR